MSRFIVTGTDTGIGKTVVSATLMLGLDGAYWKPVQAGTDEETDTQIVRRLTGLPEERFFLESHVLRSPLSPHRAAELDGIEIDVENLVPPEASRPLLIEGAGGTMVPLTRSALLVDIFRRWKAPVILCARTALGTINHTLLSVEALKARSVPIHGIVFIGEDNPDTIRTIADFSRERILGRIPVLEKLDRETLRHTFAESFNKDDFKL